MPEMTLRPRYQITIEREELRLICKALAGMIHPGSKEDRAARALNVKLLEIEARLLQDHLKLVDGAIERNESGAVGERAHPNQFTAAGEEST